ncbi:MAG: GspJ family type II secretion system protein [Pseudomonadota bacterium]
MNSLRRSTSPTSGQFGLTLPELLIALLIFSFVSGAGVAGLRLAVDGREQFDDADARLRTWAIFQTVVAEDLSNFTQRIPRDQFGDVPPGAFVGGRALELLRVADRTNETPLFAFVRGGKPNPDSIEPRSTLQYIEYLFDGSSIIRRARPYVDAAPNAASFDRVLLDELTTADASFLLGDTSRGLEWSETWPVGAVTNQPLALRFLLETDRYGPLEMLFWVGELGV